MKDKLPAVPTSGQMLIYREGELNLRVRVEGKTVWLNQRQLADLFRKDVRTVNEHVQNIYAERELAPEATIRRFRIVQTEGIREVEREVDFYNLDMILAVGYRVRSERGTLFRQWATIQLRELLVKGFVLDDERIKAGRSIGQDYFDELLERIRDIRSSERLFYQKITDIYATSIDYATTPTPRRPRPSSPRCRTSSIGQSTAAPRRKSSAAAPMPASRTWA